MSTDIGGHNGTRPRHQFSVPEAGCVLQRVDFCFPLTIFSSFVLLSAARRHRQLSALQTSTTFFARLHEQPDCREFRGILTPAAGEKVQTGRKAHTRVPRPDIVNRIGEIPCMVTPVWSKKPHKTQGTFDLNSTDTSGTQRTSLISWTPRALLTVLR